MFRSMRSYTGCDVQLLLPGATSVCMPHCSISDTFEEPVSGNKADGAQRGSCFAGQAFCVLLFLKRITASCSILLKHVLPKNGATRIAWAGMRQLCPIHHCWRPARPCPTRVVHVGVEVWGPQIPRRFMVYRRPSESESRQDQTMLVV